MRALVPALLVCLAGCRPSAPAAPVDGSAQPSEDEQGSGAVARWTYTFEVDDALERMDLGLCVVGPRPRRLVAGREAIHFVRHAQVRGGPPLRRDGRGFVVETLGEHGCVDLEIDLDAAVRASGRDSDRHGDSLMIAPDRWLWYPAVVPDALEARARFVLPDGVTATVPWPRLDAVPDLVEPEADWRALDPTSFGWNAWVAFTHAPPLEFVADECEFEVAVLAGERRVTSAGIEAWLRAAAGAGAQLYGRFPRDRVSVVVVPIPAWGDSPVLFGMARRGGGGSVMLLIDDTATDEELPGEWVAVHELLHLGMPLIADPWMSEGFVTYYSAVLRARAGLLDADPSLDAQTLAALTILTEGFADRPSARTLESASANMRQLGSYQRVYWGGAALAFDLDLALRVASHNRRSLDDLMIALAPQAIAHRRFIAADLLAQMDAITEEWLARGELDRAVSPTAIAESHLRAKATPEAIQRLRGIAVERSGQLRLLADPIDQVQLREGLFRPKDPTNTPEK